MSHLSYSIDGDLSPLVVVDANGQMARFVVKTLSVCSGLVVLMFCTRVLLLSLERWALVLEIHANLRHKNTYIFFVKFQVVSVPTQTELKQRAFAQHP